MLNTNRLNLPIIVTAGRSPHAEDDIKGGRSIDIHWTQEMFDQAGMVREAVKWDYELRDASQLEAVVDRAFNIAEALPKGPARYWHGNLQISPSDLPTTMLWLPLLTLT